MVVFGSYHTMTELDWVTLHNSPFLVHIQMVSHQFTFYEQHPHAEHKKMNCKAEHLGLDSKSIKCAKSCKFLITKNKINELS